MEFEEIKSVETLAKEFVKIIGADLLPFSVGDDIHFRYQEAGYFFDIDKQDPNFFRLVMPAIYEINNDRIKVLETLVNLTGKKKGLKAFLVGDDVWLSIEMFIDPNSNIDTFSEYTKRCFNVLNNGRLEFRIRLED